MPDKKDIKHIAKLGRLETSEKENEKLEKEFSSILDYFNMIEEIDTSKIKPTFHSVEEFIKEKAIMREDEARPENEDRVNKLIESAPIKKGRYIKVKAVL